MPTILKNGQPITVKDHPGIVVPISSAAVNAEAERRIRAGRVVSLTGYASTINLDGRPSTLGVLRELVIDADRATDASVLTTFRDFDNVIHQLTPAQILELWGQWRSHHTAVRQASWDLKDAPGGIPADYTDNSHWPAH